VIVPARETETQIDHLARARKKLGKDSIDQKQLDVLFQEKFEQDNYRVFFAPGRINLIGENTVITLGMYSPVSLRLVRVC
jgi:hypothetical protein